MSQGSQRRLPRGAWLSLQKSRLQELLDALRQAGYRTVGPRAISGAVVYDDIQSVSQLPLGLVDEQDGGRYRLVEDPEAGYFDYVVGPHSLKNFTFVARETLQALNRDQDGWKVQPSPEPGPPTAVIGARSCDLHALAVQDRVFLQGPYVDSAYQARRERLFLVAVNCRRSAATCFCHSMQTGPEVRFGFDLALTELDEAFTVQVGTERGAAVLSDVDWPLCSVEEINRAQEAPRALARAMRARETSFAPGQPRQRSLNTDGIRELLLGCLDHPRWQHVAARCLSCANCTLVCPTCFCSNVEEVADLTGDHVQRQRTWGSCFTPEHSQLSSGIVRNSIAARYRQWLTHKLASWIDQFGVSGCVGCGRCITWCPVGIDLTEEAAAIRGGSA